ncbi:polyprenyl diphosphate synthase [Allorhizocola rhizosphaerae]|uniref:polyprenyl diphosphate synthase n=1 Tax=Allorhizocola rhizosphaerae TaxID=1872709 RepID=UPI000E3DCDF8|nr:polyprenyl diphosphate synthase [Allorhizocola rhizosphaerae]
MADRRWARLAHRLYAARLRARLTGAPFPRHVALVMDGNRRWARQMGLGDPKLGHRAGGEHLEHVLGWCAGMGIRHVSVFIASVDNMRKRDTDEVDHLMRVIEDVVAERLSRPGSPWQVHLAGRSDVLPDTTRHALKLAQEATRDRGTGFHVTVAIGYDGREEIAGAVRRLLEDAARTGATLDDVAQGLTAEGIAAHLDTGGHPEPDLVIRTSGERRMSGFLLWQTAHSELYFCDVYWPGFREIDFLRALRAYAARRHT